MALELNLELEGDTNLGTRRACWQDRAVTTTARRLLARDEAVFLHQSLSTPCLTALEGAEGAELIEVGGRRILDFHGNSVHQVGHGHPRVTAAIEKTLRTLPFSPRRFTNAPAVELAERLMTLAPDELTRILFTPSGAAANGLALKIARLVTGRHKTIGMAGAFHGASLDTIAVADTPMWRDGLGEMQPGCFHIPWPTAEQDADAAQAVFEREGDIGAVIVEPMRATTIQRPPGTYWRRLRELCDKHGAMLIFDEIPTALGRTGRWFSHAWCGVEPDILVLGKGLGGGVMPMAAVLMTERCNTVGEHAVGHYTHEKSPVGCAAALATLDVIADEGLVERSEQLGVQMRDTLRSRLAKHGVVREVRGWGLAIGIELHAEDPQTACRLAQDTLYAALERGLSFKVSRGDILTLTPPLTLTDQQAERSVEIVDASLTEALTRTHP